VRWRDETYGNVFSHTSVSFRQRDDGNYTIANANVGVDRSRGNKHDVHTAKFWEWEMHLNVGVNYIK